MPIAHLRLAETPPSSSLCPRRPKNSPRCPRQRQSTPCPMARSLHHNQHRTSPTVPSRQTPPRLLRQLHPSSLGQMPDDGIVCIRTSAALLLPQARSRCSRSPLHTPNHSCLMATRSYSQEDVLPLLRLSLPPWSPCASRQRLTSPFVRRQHLTPALRLATTSC